MNNIMKPDSMDLMLYAAMPFVKNKELDEYNAAESSEDIPSSFKKKLLRCIKRERNYNERHEIYRPALETCKRVAIVVLIIFSVGFAGAMSVEAVRNEIYNAVVEWFEKSLSISFKDDNTKTELNEILEYREPQLGDDYSRYEIQKNEYRYMVEYENESVLVTYCQSISEDYSILRSNENTIAEDIEVSGYPGLMTTYLVNGITTTTILWQDDEYTYSLSSNLPHDDLLKISNSIE